MLVGPNITGAVSEGLVLAYLHSRGYEVYGPLSPHTRADLVYVDGGRVSRVQVKSASLSKGSTSPHTYEQCRVARKDITAPYTSEEIDELWVVGTHLWCFPVSFIVGKTMISLGSSNTTPRKTVREYEPDDFIVVKGSWDRRYRDRLNWSDPDFVPNITNNDYDPSTIRAMKYKVTR